MDFFLIFSKVSVIFLLIMTGYAVSRTKLVSEHSQKDLTQILLYVFAPSILLKIFQEPFDKVVFTDGIKITGIMLVIYILTTISSLFLSKFITKDKSKQAIVTLGMVLPNGAFMGYPVIASILGEEYIFYAAMGTLAFELLAWTLMVYILTQSTGIKSDIPFWKRFLSIPPILALMVGLAMYFSPFFIPEPFLSTITLLGGAMSPVAMIIVGISLSKANLSKVFLQKELYIVSAFKLFIYPLIVVFIFKFLGMSGMTYTIPIILISMPSAGYTSILAGKFGGDATFASEIVTLCTLLSLISIPIILSIM